MKNLDQLKKKAHDYFVSKPSENFVLVTSDGSVFNEKGGNHAANHATEHKLTVHEFIRKDIFESFPEPELNSILKIGKVVPAKDDSLIIYVDSGLIKRLKERLINLTQGLNIVVDVYNELGLPNLENIQDVGNCLNGKPFIIHQMTKNIETPKFGGVSVNRDKFLKTLEIELPKKSESFQIACDDFVKLWESNKFIQVKPTNKRKELNHSFFKLVKNRVELVEDVDSKINELATCYAHNQKQVDLHSKLVEFSEKFNELLKIAPELKKAKLHSPPLNVTPNFGSTENVEPNIVYILNKFINQN